VIRIDLGELDLGRDVLVDELEGEPPSSDDIEDEQRACSARPPEHARAEDRPQRLLGQ
jgi:hypothetical protein